MAFGLGAIPHSEYLAYFTIYIPLDGLQETIEILQTMDSEFLLYSNRLEEQRIKMPKTGK